MKEAFVCGIGGIVKMSDKPIEESQISTLLLGLEQRGREASGVVLVDKDTGELHIHKDGVTASTFVETKGYKEFLEEHLSAKTKTVLVHCRLHTIGTPRDNLNNHPLFAEHCAVVHNGHVSNHREQFTKMGLARKAEVDSDIIRAICDKEGLTHKTVRELSKLSGSIASAIVDKRVPNSLLLVRSGNPLCLGTSDDQIIFASLQKVVAEASKTWVKRWGIWSRVRANNMDFSIFPSDSAWFIGPNEREWHQKFQTAAYCYEPSYSRNFYGGAWEGEDEFDVGYHSDALTPTNSAQESAKAFLPDEKDWEVYYRCPSIKCNLKCMITEKNKYLRADQLVCPKCNTSLKHASKVASAISSRKQLTN
jgi:glutamine amidotransferase-like protein